MNGLPPDFDASVFVGQQLVQVCFTANTVSLHFGDAVSVTVFSTLAHGAKLNDALEVETIPISSSSVIRLIGKTITIAMSEVSGRISLGFQDGSRLDFSDDSPAYESYSVRIGLREIVV